MSRIFLSHSSRNNAEAIALKQWLSAQDRTFAAEIFLDVDPETGIQTGVRWREALEDASDRCEAVIFLLSKDWATSHECRLEYDTAIKLHKRIFCARLEESPADELTAQFQRCDLFGDGEHTSVTVAGRTEPVRFSADGLYRLFKGIRGAGIGTESFHWPPEGDAERAPYRGWEPLTEADAAVFFGRDAEIVLGLDALRGMRTASESLFVVLGPSGAGKSSFLRAGLLPRLRREDRAFTVLDIVRPERAVISGKSGLAAAIHATRSRYGLAGPGIEEIATACATDVTGVRELLVECRLAAQRRILDRKSDEAAPTLVLPVDQAEELFTSDAGPEAARFLALVAALTGPKDGIDLIVASTIRTDRYEAMQVARELSGLKTLLFDNLKPLPPNHFKDVIEGPAERATAAGRRLTIDPGLVDRLLKDSSGGADTLPILALTLASLFARHGASGRLTVEQYLAMGGTRGVVQNAVDEALSRDPRVRAFELDQLRTAFIPWLATINPENDQPMRRIARYDDLPEPSRPLIDRLVAKRLMVADRQADGSLTVEVALESLLRQWHELAGWLRDQRHNLKGADDLERSAAGWQAAGKDGGWLLAGTRLADAESLANAPGFRQRLGVAHEFLWASREAENRRQWTEDQRRQAEVNAAREKQATAEAHAFTLKRRQQVLRRVLVATALVAVIAIVGGVVAVISRQQAAEARDQAEASLRQTTVAKLRSEARAVLNDTADGSDIEAFERLLAAFRIEQLDNDSPDRTAILDGLTSRPATLKVLDTPDTDRQFALSPDGKMLVRGANDFSVRRYDADTGGMIGEPLTGHQNNVFSVAFSPDGKTIASGSGDTTVHLWDAQSGKDVGTLAGEHADAVLRVRFTTDGRHLISVGRDYSLVLWDMSTKRAVVRPMAHTDNILDVAVSRDGRLLATASYDGTARLWDAVTAEPIGEPFVATAGLSAVAFSPDGQHLVAGGQNFEGLWIWNIADHRELAKNVRGQGNAISDIEFNDDGSRMITTSLDGTVIARDPETGDPTCQPMTGHVGRVYNAVLNSDGTTIMTSGADGTIRTWDVRATCLVSAPNMWSLEFVDDADLILTGQEDGTVRRWRRGTGVPVPGVLAGPRSTVYRIAASADGRRIVTVYQDSTAVLWDGEHQTPIRQLEDRDEIKAVAISRDGRLLVTAGHDFLTLRDANTGDPLAQAPIDQLDILIATFSPDGSRIAIGSSDNSVRVLDTEKMTELGDPFTKQELVWALAFSPDGTKLASASVDKTIWLFNVDDMSPIGPLNGHVDAVTSVAFSPDGRMLASGGNDREARLWDVESRTQVGGPLRGHANTIFAISFDPRQPDVVETGSGDGAVRRWPTVGDPDALCARLTSNVSAGEWSTLVPRGIPYLKQCDDLPVPNGK